MAKINKKPAWLKKIKVLVWDLDGTLYRETKQIKNGIYKNVISLIMGKQEISYERAEKLYEKLYGKLNSASQVLIACGVSKKLVLSGEWHSKIQLKYLKKDKRLTEMFLKLKNLRHLVNTNGSKVSTEQKLKKLGLKLSIFEKIYTNADMFGVLKPDLLPFKEMLKYTGLEPERHLFIGDRVKTDLLPAKKTGMKTCLVWGKSTEVDICLPEVYNVSKLFIPLIF